MKISQIFNLQKSQFELDFIDIDPNVDTPLFLDPYFISKCEFPFAEEAHNTIRSYFEYLLALLRGDKALQAKELFSYLGENNEICMGLSSNKPNGHGMGPKDTTVIFSQLMKSKAIKTGVMEDIEDFRIFVPNVDKDKVSDMISNIIKFHLIQYTIEQCELHNIPLTQNVPSGMFWNPTKKEWDNIYTTRLVINHKPILLVPKRIVSYTDKYTSNEYRQHFVLNYLKNEHLELQSHLVQKRKDGTCYVTKKSVENYEPAMDKEYLVKFTQQHPEVFSNFKNNTIRKIASVNGDVLEDIDAKCICEHLTNCLDSIKPGFTAASEYHQLIIGILELLLYPNLSNPKKEQSIHDGRKRIDIRYNNSAESGFFFSLPIKDISLICPFVFVECKNYAGDPANPEIDQLSGRFSNRRGRVGILACRSFEDEHLFIQRCADTFHDGRGLVIPLADKDFKNALSKFPALGPNALEEIINEKYERITFLK